MGSGGLLFRAEGQIRTGSSWVVCGLQGEMESFNAWEQIFMSTVEIMN